MALSRRSILKAAIRMSVSQSLSCVDHVIGVARITHMSSRESLMDDRFSPPHHTLQLKLLCLSCCVLIISFTILYCVTPVEVYLACVPQMWKCYRETGSLKELALRVCHESTWRLSLSNTSPDHLEPAA
ncbi:hypothetical protein R3I93_012341 [Phoxinus phoxinus]|uniref:Uncharacterized protein n=1 Tax=Phoxinus phoxinus TaxID=58324 RepID=A0AAN9H314_9TELE